MWIASTSFSQHQSGLGSTNPCSCKGNTADLPPAYPCTTVDCIESTLFSLSVISSGFYHEISKFPTPNISEILSTSHCQDVDPRLYLISVSINRSHHPRNRETGNAVLWIYLPRPSIISIPSPAKNGLTSTGQAHYCGGTINRLPGSWPFLPASH